MLFLLSVIAGSALFAQIDLQPVAIIQLTRSEPLTVRQLRTEMERMIWPNLVMQLRRTPTAEELTRAVNNSTVAERRQILEGFINERLILQAAERDRITVTDNELNQQMAQLRAMMSQDIGRPVTDEEFALAIHNETGMALPAFRERMRREGTVQRYLVTTKQHIFANIREPTEAEIVSVYNLRRSEFIRPDMIRFSMIQVPYGPNATTKVQARQQAERLSREIGSSPTRFSEAVLASRRPNSGYLAGDGQWIPLNPEGQMLAGADFINTAFTLRQGEVSRIIEGHNAYLIIKVTETLPQTALGLDDLMSPMNPITVRQLITDHLMQQLQQDALMRAFNELMAEVRAQSTVRIMENNLNW